MPPPTAPGGAADTDARAGRPAKQSTEQPTQVRVAENIRRSCDLNETEAYFAFDSAQLRTSEERALQKIVECFATGPLAGRKLALVGHADPRGDDEYNMALGGRRADAVADALARRRLSRNQITTTSRGEMDATGADEPGWARDRRVDVTLAD